jgi:hypothetical protein
VELVYTRAARTQEFFQGNPGFLYVSFPVFGAFLSSYANFSGVARAGSWSFAYCLAVFAGLLVAERTPIRPKPLCVLEIAPF